ncbi:Type IV pilus biogenesis and competence protein PilQ precursor [Roseimaritima ulvae]|uniref:Type IV pilus biogenesis and competence protein PilQ n=1 Tax=Roseimaritima ulvae TaxID=980254 RepID=A0A5B9QZQ7_9BACT|nr:Type IV pilus biogenesis and competence protein PilQ precursor [Roseimaritima ulvae]
MVAAVLWLVIVWCAGAAAAEPPRTMPQRRLPQRVEWSQVGNPGAVAPRPAPSAKAAPPATTAPPVTMTPQAPAQSPVADMVASELPLAKPRPVLRHINLHRTSAPALSPPPRAAPSRPAPPRPRIALTAAEEVMPPRAIPLPVPPRADNVHVSGRNGRLSVQAIETPLGGLLAMIAEQQGLNIVSGDLSEQTVTVTLHDVDLDEAFNAILAVKGFTWTRQKNIVIVSSLDSENITTSAVAMGREVRVYNLNYVLAQDIEPIINGLLSPVGKAFTKQTNTTDQRQTHEQLVVEDLPQHLTRIESYLLQADVPPRQVLVEAHVLQVSLRDELRHGINLKQLAEASGSSLSLESPGFASDAGPTTVLRFTGSKLEGLVEAIKTTTDAKTLASPKVAVLNGQEARMQVGGQIGYLLTTTTQTSTMQSVNFLDVGVILNVTPIITDDQQVLLQVRPQVSTGAINATTQLPESETTEVETKVMLGDGEGLIIGGLIQEIDSDAQNKVPLLGNIKYVGRLFQKRQREKERNEIIIAIVPRIITNEPYCRETRLDKLDQVTTPLMHGPLRPNDRRMWEPELPDASRRDLPALREQRKREAAYNLDF